MREGYDNEANYVANDTEEVYPRSGENIGKFGQDCVEYHNISDVAHLTVAITRTHMAGRLKK